MKNRTIIIGLGNILRRDEGVGVALLEELKKEETLKSISDIKFIDGGTASYEALSGITSNDHLIILDAVKGENGTGTVYFLEPEDLKEEQMIDIHQINLCQSFNWLKMEGRMPDVNIFGIEVSDTSWGEGLSLQLKQKLDLIKRIIIDKINSLLRR